MPIPPEIKEIPPGNPSLTQVLSDPKAYQSQRVRWGGVILETENREDATWLTILALPLDKRGKPIVEEKSPGRFIAVVPRFLEPVQYGRDRMITVIGAVLRTETKKVGKFPYRYPLLQVESHYLWPAEPVIREGDLYPYWWYDPWYIPGYPYPHPYWW